MFIELEWIDLIKITAAIVIGGVIGAEREYRDKAAGLRTNILICLGAALFTMFSIKLAAMAPDAEHVQNDATRIASYVVAGIGFLGAGSILREGNRIVGLTTASTIWAVAALGIGIGSGQWVVAGAGTIAVLIALFLLRYVEHWFERAKERRVYRVVSKPDQSNFRRIEASFAEVGLAIRSHAQMKGPDHLRFSWTAIGTPHQHDAISRWLVDDQQVIEFEV